MSPPLDGDVRCEAIVIGAGVTGALVSYLLTQAGVDTVLIDQGQVGAGSTAASTGLLLYEIDTPLVKLIDMVGERAAVRAYRRGIEAIDALEAISHELGDQCEFIRRSALYLAREPQHLSELQREHDCRRYFGFEVSYLAENTLGNATGLHAYGALQSRGDAEINPYQFTQSLVSLSLARGLRAHSHTRVIDVRDGGSRSKVITESGQIETRSVIFATGYFAQPSLPPSKSKLHTTYALATQPLGEIPRWPDRCLIWDTGNPYLYLRRTADGRVVIGGEDTSSADDHQDPQLLRKKAASLKAQFERLFPETHCEPEYTWAGSFAETADGLPFIGRSPGHDQFYLALGYGGNGITFSMIAAELIRDMILGRANEDESIFHLGR